MTRTRSANRAEGSKNDRQRWVSTETKRQSAKLKSRGGRKHKNAERDSYRGDVGRKTRTRVERRPQLGEEEKQRREYEIPQQEKLGGRSGRLEKTCNRKTRKKRELTAGR